ncbi:MAG: hypothetical protein H6506_04815 [Calditrichaeota bacterium]|nr:hypothetical protein [Calditrichota bacterium]MCB9391957.1 hypothetical protein [Calditrichota bacterium]
MQRSLPELNALKSEHKLKFDVYAVHAEGESDRAIALMDSHDVHGKPWGIDFVFGSDALNERLSVAGYPSYYVIDDHARPVAVLIGHPDNTMDILDWLIIEAKKRR